MWTDVDEPDGFYDGKVLAIERVGIPGATSENVTSYLNANGTFKLAAPLPFIPAAGDHVRVLNLPLAGLGAILAQLGIINVEGV